MECGLVSNSVEIVIKQSINRERLIQKHDSILGVQRVVENTTAYRDTVTGRSRLQRPESRFNDIDPSLRVNISDLVRAESTILHSKYFVCRVIAPALKVSAVATVVEDPEGEHGCLLVLCNCIGASCLKDLAVLFPVGSILGIKNPHFNNVGNGGYGVKCENGEEILFLNDASFAHSFPQLQWKAEIPEIYRKYIRTSESCINAVREYTQSGNIFFAQRRYAEALNAYNQALDIGGPNNEILVSRSATYWYLSRFVDALIDADAAIDINPQHLKAIFRKFKALSGLHRYREGLGFITSKSAYFRQNNLDGRLLIALGEEVKRKFPGKYKMLDYM